MDLGKQLLSTRDGGGASSMSKHGEGSEFQSVIGKETRRQAMEKWGGKPYVLVACVGSGSNALGLFH